MADSARVCPRCRGEYAIEVLFCPRDGTPLTGRGKTEIQEEDPYLGVDIAEQFRIEQLIGVGAMGRVYRAHQRGIDRPVAVKILHRELMRNPAVSSRFQREARVASRLSHPNVVQVLMTGELLRRSADVGGEAYIIMEYLDGLSLRSALAATGGALPLPRALHIVLQVCDAVGEAHAQGIVHRDLKPENVMLVRRGDDRNFSKVLDFGVARIEWADATVATQAGVIFGTARYISPEGARGEPVSPASDVYSLGVILFQCLAGHAPFEGDSPISILIQHTSAPAPELRQIERASYVPEPIARVVAQALAKDPSQRPSTARELGRALVDAARSGGLRPDDLVVRSTLLGDGKSVTVLKSMERTKALELSPGLMARLGGDRQSQTRVLEEPTAQPTNQDPGHDHPKPRHPIEPTLADQPAPAGASIALDASAGGPPTNDTPGSGGTPRVGTPSGVPSHPTPGQPTGASPAEAPPTGAIPPRDETEPCRLPGEVSSPSSVNFPDSIWDPPEDEGQRSRRWLVVGSCFAIGVLLALVIAMRLGAFSEPHNELATVTRRVRVAIAASAWDAPSEGNVRDLLREARARWPGHPALDEVAREASSRLVVRAQLLLGEDDAEALRLARLAAELDPASIDATRLIGALETPPASGSADDGTAVPPPSSIGRPQLPPSRGGGTPSSHSAGPSVSAAASASAESEASPEVAPTPSGGRWL
ncbi:MAG: protein kinase [Polyangiaceae bacterium]|nr:protein kinase [Polyangiaceae bacterium]